MDVLTIWILIQIVSPEEVAATNTTINKYIYVDNSVNIGDKNKLEGSGILGGGKGHG